MGTLTETTHEKMSFEEFLAKQGEEIRAEWIDGEAVLMSSLATPHQRIVGFLYSLINAYIDRNPCGDVLQDVTVKLGPTLSARVPDLSFLRTEHAGRDRMTFIDGPVDIAVEVISLDSRIRDRADKYYEYEAAGTSEYWLMDPIREQADFFVLESNGKFKLCPLVGEGYFESIVLPGLRVFPKWLWQNPLPRVPSISEEAGITLPG